MRWGYSSTGANRSWSRQQGKAAVDSGIEDLRMILPLSMAIDAKACLACWCRRAKQRLPKVSVHPAVAAPRAGTGTRDHVVKLVRRVSPTQHRNTLHVTPCPKTVHTRGVIPLAPALGLKRGRSVRETRHWPGLDRVDTFR